VPVHVSGIQYSRDEEYTEGKTSLCRYLRERLQDELESLQTPSRQMGARVEFAVGV
jgi:hypothetical protein